MNNPWKVTAIAIALVMATALVTGLVVANWTGSDAVPRAAAPAAPTQAVVTACNEVAARETGSRDKTVEVVKDSAIGAVAGAAIGAAGGAIAGGGKGAGKGAAIGGIVGAGGGALYGLNENKKHDERYREAYARCLRARGYAG